MPQYAGLTVAQLKAECTRRGLSDNGLKGVLVQTLLSGDRRIQLKPLQDAEPPDFATRNRARVLAGRLRVVLPTSVLGNDKACREFISDNE